MADDKSEPKTLEMRVAELEDKLSKLYVTEEEMKAYRKVSGLLGGVAAICDRDDPWPWPPPPPPPPPCRYCWPCSFCCAVRPCTVKACEGPEAGAGEGVPEGGFGSLGT